MFQKCDEQQERDPEDFFSGDLSKSDPSVLAVLAAECRRQQEQIELIASENIVSRAVL